jgi:hypothetical protein
MSKSQQNLTLEDKVTLTPVQRAELVARVESARVLGQEAVVEAARVTHAVVEAGLIGDTDKGAEWSTQGDYAVALGVSGGNLSGLKALGKALALGLDTGHPAFNAVYANRQSLGKVAKSATRLSAITAEAKRLAKSTPTAPVEADAPEGIWTAVSVIREGIGDLTREDARTLVASLSTLLEEAKGRVKSAPAAPVAETA